MRVCDVNKRENIHKKEWESGERVRIECVCVCVWWGGGGGGRKRIVSLCVWPHQRQVTKVCRDQKKMSDLVQLHRRGMDGCSISSAA